jgi:4-amino-4-deoxy-L-arabinose transferase-like glycosyltransferase
MTRVGESRTTGGTAVASPSPDVGAPRTEPSPSEQPRHSLVDHARAHPARTYALLLVLAVAGGAALRLLFLDAHVSSPDEATYLTSGISWWQGHGFTTISGSPELHFPPGLPFLLGGIHEVVGGDPHTATNIAAVLTSALTILPVAGIARLMGGRRVALLAAAIAALAPGLVVLPLTSGGSAGPFTLLVLTTVWLALRSWTARSSTALLMAAGAGLGVGLAYLTRPEGIAFTIVVVPMLVLPVLGGWRGVRHAPGSRWKRAGLLAGAFLVPLLLVAAPYVAYLHEHTGEWELTAKTRDVSIASWRAVAEENRPGRQAILYDPGPTGYEFPATHSLPSLIRDDPGGYLDIVGTNLSRGYQAVFDTSITPYPHWALLPALLVLLAAYAVWRHRREPVVLATVAAIAIPVLSAVVFLMQARYLVPAAAFTCALVALGLVTIPARWFKAAVIATLLLLVTSTGANLYSATNGWFHLERGSDEHRLAGEWIAEHSRAGDLVMSTTTIPGFYAGRATVPTPYAGQARVIDFMRHYGVRYLIVDQAHGTRFRPQLRPLAYHNRRKEDLRAVYRHREDGRRLVVYELVPRPSPAKAGVPRLGQVGDSS